MARNPDISALGKSPELLPTSDDDCRVMDEDTNGWVLNRGTESLGRLVAEYPNQFGKAVLTTNFDPLIEVAIRKAGGTLYKTMLHADGYLGQTEAPGCHVVHLHGYWYGSDTLHTALQLGQERPRLKASLSTILKNKLLVISAYGGWDDIFSEALIEIVHDDAAQPEVLWAFYESAPSLPPNLLNRLGPGIERGIITLYHDVDCHRFLPSLHSAWRKLEPPVPLTNHTPSNPVSISSALVAQVEDGAVKQTVLEGDDEDRPPVVDICVGRERELQIITESSARVVFLTGLGGQGKSTVATQYFEKAQVNRRFSFYVWRDCKEERERFENQLASVIERLSEGRISGEDLAQQSAQAIVDLLTRLIENREVLFVFDNVDHHANLEAHRMVGSTELFIEALLSSRSRSQAVFTCRVPISYEHEQFLSCELKGLSLGAAVSLFSKRGAAAESAEIEQAHELTRGHAFWLDLLAIQAARRASDADITSLLRDIRAGAGVFPETTLASIWETLKSREQLVLRAMAETVKPETEEEISEYVRRELTYQKVQKALKLLKDLNLIVVKRRNRTVDLLELHPVVRQFVRRNFQPQERVSFIDAIITRTYLINDFEGK